MRAANPGLLTLDGTRTYLVGESRPIVLDPGPDDAAHRGRILDALRGRPVAAICLTHAHPDHAAGTAALAEALGAPLRAGVGTLRRLGLSGRPLADGEPVPGDGGELRALETPGHTADGLSYLRLPGRELFTGDLVLGEGTSVIVHPDGSVGDYLASLARLVALRPFRILPGHGPPVEDAVERLESYRAHRLERDRQVLAAVREGADSIGAIRRAVYPALPAELSPAAELSIAAHLRHLREIGYELPEIGGEPPLPPAGERASGSDGAGDGAEHGEAGDRA